MSLIDETIYKANGSKNETEKKGRLVPKGRKRVAYRKLITGLVFLGLFVTQNGKFNFSVSLQDQFIKESLLYRYVPFHKLCTLLFTYSYEKQYCLHPDLWLFRENKILCYLDSD